MGLYVLNGFYARMRDKFTSPGVIVNWFVVEFDAAQLPWKSFRGELVGATNPPDSPAGSLRGQLRDRWQELGLADEPNYQDNGVHASAGPLEALKERFIWLGEDPAADPFGKALLAKGANLESLLENPMIELKGESGRVFDLLEDVDAAAALNLLAPVSATG